MNILRKLKRKIRKTREVFIVSKKAKWSLFKTNKELNKAKRFGVSSSVYITNECWNLAEDKIKELGKVNAKISKKSEAIESLMKKSKLNEDEAKKKIDFVKSLGISYNDYFSYYMFELNNDELKEFSKVIKEKRKVVDRNNRFFVQQVCIKSGWNRAKALNEMEKIKKYGVSFQKYVQKGVYGYSDVEKERFIKFMQREKKRISTGKEYYITEIMKATGWSRGKTELEVNKAKVNCECSYEDYLGFKMYELTPKEQKTYVTLAVFDRMRIKYNEYRITKDNFDNKVQFNKVFSKYIKRVWLTNDDLTYEDFEKKIKGLKKVIVKPLLATCGIGVEAFECNKSKKQNKELYNHIMSLGKSIIEEYIVQSKEMSEFCPTSVNTIRVFTVLYKGKCIPIYGFLRMGNGGVVDNFHADGLAAGLDVQKGIVETNAVDLGRNVYEKSPSTGKKIKGFKIPCWDEIMEICDNAAKEVPESKLIGWDFAITDKGVDLIEGNPGAYYVAQLVNVEDRRGLMPVMVDPYL